MTTTESTNLDLVRQVYAHFAAGNIEAILAANDPNIEWISGGSREDFPTLGARKGIEGAASFFKDVAQHDEFTSFEPRQIIAMGIWSWRAVTTASRPNRPASTSRATGRTPSRSRTASA